MKTESNHTFIFLNFGEQGTQADIWEHPHGTSLFMTEESYLYPQDK